MDILGPTNMNRGPSGPPPVYYLPLTNTATDPTYSAWRTSVSNRYTFVPNDGIYLDDPFTTMRQMFFTSSAFNDPDVALWDTSLVTDMYFAFSFLSVFNHDIGGLDTSSVTNMLSTFRNSPNFSQDLTGWCVSLIPTAPPDFSTGSGLTPAQEPIWGTCP